MTSHEYKKRDSEGLIQRNVYLEGGGRDGQILETLELLQLPAVIGSRVSVPVVA